ncbi:hypothetical protein ACFU7Y_16890 [Kitasatospora sp. NPDC057542]|uniref:hypothetical protein n=1 Tax=Streptomycetaceae TaxID=2062 RepID=UPI001CCDABEE|nr:hypothetical protein [Streptomyces sp. LS1784]
MEHSLPRYHGTSAAGWIALLYQPDGASLLVDTLSHPKTHPTADLALDAILRAHQIGPQTSAR